MRKRQPRDMESAKRRRPGGLTMLGGLIISCAAVFGDNIISVREGDNVEFHCNYPSTFQNPRVEWKFNSSQDTALIYYNGELTVPYQNRAQYYPQGLRLLDVSRKDAGEYLCEVTDNSAGKPSYIERKTQLVVSGIAMLIYTMNTVKEGDNVEFHCNYPSTFQNPRVEWKFISEQDATLIYYNGELTVPYQNRAQYYPQGLRLNDVTLKDAGQYLCEVTDISSGTTMCAKIATQLTVLAVAMLCFSKMTVKEGDNVEFPCNYPSTFHNPRIEWKFISEQDAALIYYNGELTVPYQNRAQYYPQGLRLNDVTLKDAGQYLCEVTDISSGTTLYVENETQLTVLESTAE